jgi:phospholipid N-methyltransferase
MLLKLYQKIRKNIQEDGLIIDSSSFLVNAMIRHIDFGTPIKVLEIGSGRGAFTSQLIQRLNPQSHLDICEIKQEYNPYIESLIQQHPDKSVSLHNCCVTTLLSQANHYDVVLSSLPLKNFEDSQSENAFLNQIIQGVQHSLVDNGTYLQYQYFRSNQKDIERIFGKAMDEVNFIPLNILPAFVYQIRKQAAALQTPATPL